METQDTFNSQRGGEYALPSSANARVSPSDVWGARLKRVGDYEKRGVAQAEPFETFLAVIQAELFRIAIMLEDAVEQSFKHDCCGEYGGRAANRPITQYLRAARQIEQNVRLEISSRN